MNTVEHRDLYKRYSMIIEWSDEDGVYVVTLPEFPNCHTHGSTREEALKNGQEVLELLIDSNEDWESPLPTPKLFYIAELEEQTASGSLKGDELDRRKVG